MIPGQDRHSWCKAITRSQLPAGARLVAHTIALYTDPTGGQGVWVTAEDLARMTGLSRATVRRYLELLRAGGWVNSDKGARFLAWPGELPLGQQAAGAPR